MCYDSSCKSEYIIQSYSFDEGLHEAPGLESKNTFQ